MSTYRKKPVEVEAMKIAKPWNVLHAFAPEATFVTDVTGRSVAFVMVKTLEGTMRAELGDYLIRGVEGELYPCKSSIFEATYEELDGSSGNGWVTVPKVPTERMLQAAEDAVNAEANCESTTDDLSAVAYKAAIAAAPHDVVSKERG
jgi:hypothetical protein